MSKLIQIPNTSSFVQPGDVKRITSGTGCVVVHMVDGWKIQADCYTNQTEKELCKHIGNFVNAALDPIPADWPAPVPNGDCGGEVWMLEYESGGSIPSMQMIGKEGGRARYINCSSQEFAARNCERIYAQYGRKLRPVRVFPPEGYNPDQPAEATMKLPASPVPSDDMPAELWMLWQSDDMPSRGCFVTSPDEIVDACTYIVFASESEASIAQDHMMRTHGINCLPVRVK